LLSCGGGGGGNSGPHTVSIARTPAQLKWADANSYCAGNSFNGQSGWRLPTQPELTAYAQTGQDDVDGKGGGEAWSSAAAQPTYHYAVNLNLISGTAEAYADVSYLYVRCAHD
jgi:hypothetical protein